MERYLVGDSFCEDMIKVNFRNMRTMMDAVFAEPTLEENEIHFFNRINIAFSFPDETYEKAKRSLYYTHSVMVDCDSVNDSCDLLLNFWKKRYEKFTTPGDSYDERRSDLALACVCFLEYCIDLLRIVESACETGLLGIPYIMVFLVVKEISHIMEDYAHMEGIDLDLICPSCSI